MVPKKRVDRRRPGIGYQAGTLDQRDGNTAGPTSPNYPEWALARYIEFGAFGRLRVRGKG